MTHLCAVGFRVRILARQPRGASPLVIVKAPPAAREARPSTNGPSPKTGFTDIPPRERARARAHTSRNTIGSRECMHEEVRIGAPFRGAQLRFRRRRTSRTGLL